MVLYTKFSCILKCGSRYLFYHPCLNSCIDVDIVRSDMSQHMKDWITGQVLINVGNGVAFDEMSDDLVDKLNQQYGKQWLAIDGHMKNLPSSVIAPNTTIILRQDKQVIGFVKIPTNECQKEKKVIIYNLSFIFSELYLKSSYSCLRFLPFF